MKNENICTCKDFYKIVHSSIYHKSPKLEIDQIFINWQMNKFWYSYTMEFCVVIKAQNINTHNIIWINLKKIIRHKRLLM